MKTIHLLCIFIVLYSCQNRERNPFNTIKNIDTTNAYVEQQNDTSRFIEIGYTDRYENLIKLEFDTISAMQFDALTSPQHLSSYHPNQNGDTLVLQTVIQKHAFKAYRDYGGEERFNGNECLGYYPQLKLFVMNELSNSENLGFSELFLLDSITDYTYTIISIGDGRVEIPIPSITNVFLVYYYNQLYEHHKSEIRILKVNDKKNPKNYLKEYASFSSNEFAIETIKWKSDNCFYVKGYVEIYVNNEWKRDYTYYQTTFN